MNFARFNGSLRAARINAERHRAELEAIYADYIRQSGAKAARSFRTLTAATSPPTSEGNPDWQVPPEGVLFDATVIPPPRKLAQVHRQIVDDIAQPALARLGISWTVTHPLSQRLLDSASMRTGQRLGEAVQPILRETVLDAYQRGLSVPDTAALITERIEDATAWQAHMLARTDLNSLGNGGSVMAAQMAGVEYKQWLTAEDDRVRETHIEADGQVVPIDAPFIVGGEELDYPGDPAGSDAETCNCRCTVIYLDPGEVAETASATVNSAAMAADPVAWQAVLAVEGQPTEDGRMLAPDSITWRDLPLTLMAQTETAAGHDGAEVAGRIDRIWRDGANIMGAGVFDAGEFGTEIARMVADQTLRGVSVDLAVLDAVFATVQDDGSYEEIQTDGELVAVEGAVMVVTDGVIGAATVCAFPAIGDAAIQILDGRLASALGALTHVTEMAAKLGEAEQRARRLEQAARAAAEDHHRDTIAQRTEMVAMIESLTARIAAGEQVSEAMLSALSKLNDRQPRTISVVRDQNGRAAAYEVA